jgi:hypothetical protein
LKIREALKNNNVNQAQELGRKRQELIAADLTLVLSRDGNLSASPPAFWSMADAGEGVALTD